MSGAARSERLSGRQKTSDEFRSEAQRDRDRVLYSAAFRRLAGVTQVASAAEGHFFHNRLTHSLKVGQVGRRLAERLSASLPSGLLQAGGGLDPDVVETAGLLHDIGHPPFGHLAEDELQRLGKSACVSFEGNAQTFRVVATLAFRRDGDGLDLTRATLNAVLKYPWPRADSPSHPRHRKFSYYFTEQDAFAFARHGMPEEARDKKCLEAELMDLADDVTYAVHDVDDFYRAGLVPLHSILQPTEERAEYVAWLLKLTDSERKSEGKPELTPEERGVRESFIGQLFDEIREVRGNALLRPYAGLASQVSALQGFTSFLLDRYLGRKAFTISAAPPYLAIAEQIAVELNALKNLMRRFVYESPGLVAQQRGQRGVIKTLFEVFLEAVGQQNRRGLLPPHLHEQANEVSSDDGAVRLAMDAITCLTEEQAVRLYRRVTGLESGSLSDAHSRAI